MSEVEKTREREMRLFSIFKSAIEAEQEAQRTYKKALEYCDNPTLREVLQRLHDDESHHEKQLVEYYKQLREKYDTNGRPK